MEFQDYNEVINSTDQFALLRHCKEAVIENDGDFTDWDGGEHVVDVYLEHNEFIRNDPDARNFIIKELNDWLNDNIH